MDANDVQGDAQPLLSLADAALPRIRALMAQNANRPLRIFIEGGGCSGLHYGFSFESERAADDFVLELAGVTVLVDSVSAQYLRGARVDFCSDLQGERLDIDNPNVQTECGCHASFSV